MEDYSADERLQQETLRQRQWADQYVERSETLMRQNVVVVWLECLLVDVDRHTGTLAPDRFDIFVCETKAKAPHRKCFDRK